MDVKECAIPQFNLLDEPWIPVSLLDGSTAEVSLRDLFSRAHEIRAISGEVPLEYIVILRLALAVLYSAYWGAGDTDAASEEALEGLWKHLFSRNRFDMDEIGPYLEEVHDRFDLFGSDPFYQVADLVYAAKDPDPVSELIIDMPKPDKFLFSMRSMRENLSLSYAEAARYLLLSHAYDPSGIKSPVVGYSAVKGGKAYPPKGMLGTGWCGSIGGLFIEDDNLFRTIMRNWVLHLNGVKLLGIEGDLAPWERPSPCADMVVREPVGPIDLLTWQSRRMRLVPSGREGEVAAVVICYGDAMRAADKDACELMTSWRESREQQKKLQTTHIPLMPISPDPTKALWRGLSSILGVSRSDVGSGGDLRSGVVRWADRLALSGSGDRSLRPVRIREQGVAYGTQSSVIVDMVDDFIDLDASMLLGGGDTAPAAIEMVAQAEAAVRALVRFVQNVQRANGSDRPSEDQGVRERAYDELDAIFRRRLAHCAPGDGLEAYCNAWRDEIRVAMDRIAASYLSASGLSAFRECDSMTSGRAISIFRASLAKILVHTGEDAEVSPKSDGHAKEECR